MLKLLGQGSGWSAPISAQYGRCATMTALVYFEDTLITDENDQVAIFAGTELRGLASRVMIAGDPYYFMSIYSNNTSEYMTLKYYNSNLDLIFISSIPFLVKSGRIYGNIENPHELFFYEDNVTPIKLGPIPNQMGLENCLMSPIYLSDYLKQQDTFGTNWYYFNNPNLQVTLVGDTLSITGVPNFSGTTNLTVSATSQAPGNPTDTTEIIITLNPQIAAPLFGIIPDQGIQKGDTFELFDLSLLEVGYSGNHLGFNYLPIVEESDNPISPPSWSPGTSYNYNMTITAKVNFTPNYQFNHVDDILGAFINGQLTGTATQNASTGLYLFVIG
ncbi:MAG: hypothetical protein HOP11_13125 [Saprospiraceae bacterium]|nr:hypothetical protein [Saprospiraceae bacterium]